MYFTCVSVEAVFQLGSWISLNNQQWSLHGNESTEVLAEQVVATR